ncbi:OLC1v1015668C1 [Oldenlandia corymbosa var. corymbosa]|uniref:OLC1v1015668C1 n=1 Tax=Oldenlandia corymbosa var. corymbosa TaxID=529605 RepID=A0AAV1E6U9_OLDCO|nr:OLC1v1015668C1 [Oldenlandia corymbosa var. corymbosa]
MSSVALQVFALLPQRFSPELSSKFHPSGIFGARIRTLSAAICCSGSDNTSQDSSTQQQLNLSVLRFTFGIPGLDESYLPRYIGYAFGSLLLVNHFVGSDSSALTPAQIRTEVLGLSLAAFSVFIPYLGKFLKGATTVSEKTIPEGADQIFLIPQDVSDILKEDLAWGTYVLLRNTNTVSVLIFIQDALCLRGYWSSPKDMSNDQLCDWFAEQIQKLALLTLKEELYFPQAEELWKMLPKGTQSVLVQPILSAENLKMINRGKIGGFVLLASTSTYAYNSKDRAWTKAIANKFRV